MQADFYLPYLIDYRRVTAEELVIFCVAFLTAIVVSAGAQAFVATLLGDSGPNDKERVHFDFFRRLDLLGTVSFFVAGFGWAREVVIDPNNFKGPPRLFLLVSRLSGPMANFLMANIAASLSWVIGRFGLDDAVFSTLVVVNVTMAVYSLIPLPPLPGSALLYAFMPGGPDRQRAGRILGLLGGLLIIALFATARLTGWQGISSLLNPVVSGLTAFILRV